MIPKTKKILKKSINEIASLFKFIGKICLKFLILICFSFIFIINKILILFKINFVNSKITYKNMIRNIIKNE